MGRKQLLNDLIAEEMEMNRQRLEHCERCHSAIKSETIEYEKDRPVIVFLPPERCNICKDDDYDEDSSMKKGLPTKENGLLCKCKYPGCEKTFFNRPSWFEKQQNLAKGGNIWMPALIEPDQKKISNLCPNFSELAPK